jgi:type II secretory pathway pseudopilin PulG
MILAVSTFGIVVLAVLVVLALLFVGGYVAASRRNVVLADNLRERIEAADAELAAARAQDRGWERATMESAARTAVAPREVVALHLIQVVDKPGTDADQAVFRAEHSDGDATTVILGRRDGAWIAV